MNIFQTFRVALRALVRNKLRSFLTALGIIIGVSAVIAMVGIGEGAKKKVSDAFSSLGSNLLIVMSGSSSHGGAAGGSGSMPSITWDDVEAIRKEASAVRYTVAALRTNAQVFSEDQNWSTSVVGTTPEYFDARNWPMAEGERFSDSDVDGGVKVTVLGRTVVDNLFGKSANAVGQTVRIKNQPFLVLGVLAKKGQNPMGQDYDDTLFVPQSTFQAKIQGSLQKFVPGIIMLSAVSETDTARAEKQVTEILRDRHNIPFDEDDDFSIRNLAEMASAQEDSMKILSTLLASIAAVSLLVGGIGIMNIMLVSVTERTREIGLRMAVGAKPGHILAQFLVEALTLSVSGGIIGVAIGLLGAFKLAAKFDWPILLQPEIIVLSVGFSALVGVVFGLYPAMKASRLDPIEALRYE